LYVYKTLSEEYFIDAPTKIQTDRSGSDSERIAFRSSYSVWDIPLVLGVGTSLAYPRGYGGRNNLGFREHRTAGCVNIESDLWNFGLWSSRALRMHCGTTAHSRCRGLLIPSMCVDKDFRSSQSQSR